MKEPLEADDQEAQAQAAPVPVGALHVPPSLARWEAEVTAASQAHAVPESLIYGVMGRETEGGDAPGYQPKGSAAGTGDWTARVGHWLQQPHVRIVTELPPGWHPPRNDKGEVVPGPYAIPEDGLGWGRGLMQHDFHSALAFDWRSAAVNIEKAAELLRKLLDEFPANPRAACAAYNCGPHAVRQALLDGLDVDHFTTRRNYSADVWRRRKSYLGETP